MLLDQRRDSGGILDVEELKRERGQAANIAVLAVTVALVVVHSRSPG
jgi:hypothetical protein